MNPEYFLPYDWTSEFSEIRSRMISFFDSLAQSKRLSFDPFKDKTVVRCTFRGCKIRYDIPNGIAEDLRDFKNIVIILSTLKATHEHFLEELDLILVYPLISFKNKLLICTTCLDNNPFPSPGFSGWSHTCKGKDWLLNFSKPNTLSWKNPVWLLQINYSMLLWYALYTDFPNTEVKFDEKANCWLVTDSRASEVSALCKRYLPFFTHFPKPSVNGTRPHQVLSLSKKSIAAGEILSLLPPEPLKKLYRFMCLELHPDKGGSTEIFQRFQQSWGKWEKS